jgi:hypothetical protein
MSRRQRSALLAVCTLIVFLVAAGTRTLYLYWSPYPATLDGFNYAATAQVTVSDASFPVFEMAADTFTFTSLLVVGGLVTDKTPLTAAQPIVAVVGAGSCLTAVAIARRAGVDLGWPRKRRVLAATLAGLGVALSGVYVRRTGVADEEILGLLIVPLLAIAGYRALDSRRPAWGLLTALFVAVLPTIHNFSAIVGVVTLLSVAALHAARRPTLRNVLSSAVTIAGGWLWVLLYYNVAARLGLTFPYTDRLREHPWLFVSWLVVLVVGVVWFRRTTGRNRRVTFGLPLVFGLVIVAVNVFTPIFPGTVPSPPRVAASVMVYVVVVLFAGYGASYCGTSHSARPAPVIVSLFAAPLVLIYFALTADLTPDFFGQIMRTQTFVHVPAFVLGGLGIAGLVSGTSTRREEMRSVIARILCRPAARRTVVAAFLVGALLTLPLAYVDLDTGAAPSTTTDAEFEAAVFGTTHLCSSFTTDDPLVRISEPSPYMGDRASGGIGGARRWLRNGEPPSGPTLTAESWTTTGAHFFPAAPETIPPAVHDAWIAERNLVYTSSGRNPLYFTTEPGAETATCR